MDLRSLDPFVLDPPGRTGNLYEEFDWVAKPSAIQETPLYPELPSQTQCQTVSSAGTLCFQQHIPRQDTIPERRIDFDPNIEQLRTTVPSYSYGGPPQILKEPPNLWIPGIVILLIVLYFAKW